MTNHPHNYNNMASCCLVVATLPRIFPLMFFFFYYYYFFFQISCLSFDFSTYIFFQINPSLKVGAQISHPKIDGISEVQISDDFGLLFT